MSNTYFAQAREYVSYTGRFAGQDVIKGFTEIPYSLNAYLYCWGNPLVWVDLNGLDPVTAAEGAEAHKLLQDELKKNPNVEVEKTIPGYGRADIVYNNNGISEVYEIKPGSYAPGAVNHEAGVAQLQRYITGLEQQGKIAEKGLSLYPIISITIKQSKIHEDKLIKYYVYPEDPGMIYWGYINKPKREREFETVTVVEKEDVLETAGKAAGGVVLLWLGYQVFKWSVAAIAAAPTGGTSLIGAACIP